MHAKHNRNKGNKNTKMLKIKKKWLLKRLYIYCPILLVIQTKKCDVKIDGNNVANERKRKYKENNMYMYIYRASG